MSRLRGERERLGLTQEAMRAILWGMPHRTFQDIESERRQPPEWVMAAILEKLSKRKSHANRRIV
jgi:DNA-binding XRE family transcriptional regulator